MKKLCLEINIILKGMSDILKEKAEEEHMGGESDEEEKTGIDNSEIEMGTVKSEGDLLLSPREP